MIDHMDVYTGCEKEADMRCPGGHHIEAFDERAKVEDAVTGASDGGAGSGSGTRSARHAGRGLTRTGARFREVPPEPPTHEGRTVTTEAGLRVPDCSRVNLCDRTRY